MQITIEMIESKEFKIKPRGYDQQEVDEFLDAICDEMAAQQDQIRGKAADILHQIAIILPVLPQMYIGEKNDPAALGQLAGMDLIKLCGIVGTVIADILPQCPADQSEQSNKDQQRQQYLLPERCGPLCAAAVCVSAILHCAFSVLCFDKSHILSVGGTLHEDARSTRPQLISPKTNTRIDI